MNVLVKAALAQPTVVDGLVLIAITECQRAWKQTDAPQQGAITTQFQTLFEEYMSRRGVVESLEAVPKLPIPIIITCPSCGGRHIDAGEFETKPHRDHACQNCGLVWRPALVPTVGVKFLPGYRDETGS